MAKAKETNVYDVIKLIGATKAIDEVQKKFKLAASTTDIVARRSTCVSSGLLVTDLMLNGGVYPGGWYTSLGPEASGKSTLMLAMLTAFYHSDVPVVMYYDPENAMTPEYLVRITKNGAKGKEIDLKSMFGVRNPKTNNWEIEPRVWYSSESSLENIWMSISATLKRLPDKVFIDNEWYLLFDRTKENISKFKGQNISKIGDQFGKIAIKSLDGGAPQALFIIDSYPMMTTDSSDEDEGDNALAVDARAHSKHVKKVKGKLKRKHATVIGVNQLRQAIAVGFSAGPNEYEPCGQALRYASDSRIRVAARSVPHGKGAFEEEDSVEYGSGVDTYRYVCMRAQKNKFGTPNLEVWARLWVSDPEGQAHGYCPVYDCYQYLLLTDQIEGSMGKGLTIKLKNGWVSPKLKWLEFKSLVLLTGKDLKDFCKSKNIDKNPKLRETCFKQIKSGEGVDLYYATMHGLNEDDSYEDWTDKELIKEVVERDLMNKKSAKSSDRADLIRLLEVDDNEETDDE